MNFSSSVGGLSIVLPSMIAMKRLTQLNITKMFSDHTMQKMYTEN